MGMSRVTFKSLFNKCIIGLTVAFVISLGVVGVASAQRITNATPEQMRYVKAIANYVGHTRTQFKSKVGEEIQVVVYCHTQKVFEVIRDFTEADNYEAVDGFIRQSFQAQHCTMAGPEGRAIKGKELFSYNSKYSKMHVHELYMPKTGAINYTMIPEFTPEGAFKMTVDTLEQNGMPLQFEGKRL